MPTKSRPKIPSSRLSDNPSSSTPHILSSEPVLVGPSRLSPRHHLHVYDAVDFLGTRFRLGDNISLRTPEGDEWVCRLELLFKNPDTQLPTFNGRWFWSLADVRNALQHHPTDLHKSKCESHELIASDNRDSNLVESISRKCHVLSYDNFQLVKKTLLKSDYRTDKVYYCERQYYHKAFKLSDLNSLLFPGDPIPADLRKAAGLPELQSTALDTAPYPTDAFFEPDLLVPKPKRKSNAKAEKTSTATSQPLLIW